MESVSSKRDDTVRRQAELLQQIEAIKAQLAQIPEAPTTPPPASSKNHITAPTVLAPSTPSPKKKRARLENDRSPSRAPRQNALPRPPLIVKQSSKNLPDKVSKVSKPALTSLKAQLHTLNQPDEAEETIARSEGFSEKPAPLPSATADTKSLSRDDRLAVIEDLKLGPSDHKPSLEDPNFEKLEPNSGIRLSSRLLSHAALQDHLYGRYFLPPTLLYSVVRMLPNKQAYEVPVDADWVTIAVVAERGDVKVTNGPANYSKNKEDEGLEVSEETKTKEKNPTSGSKRKRDDERENAEENPRRGKKYVHMKLIDLGTMSRTSSSSAAHRGSLRGDAQLNFLLFESDHYDKIIEKVEDANGKKKEKVTKLWKGGSGGAFEECYVKLREGAVVALLNPKVLKPFNNTKNPGSASVLALTPPSASAIAIIGYAQDLGKCTVRKRDGSTCGSWVDRRHSHVAGKAKGEDVCEYHIQTAVQHARASRPEFSIGTTGISTTSRRGSSFHPRGGGGGADAFDPERKWGLKPEGPTRGADGETTYVLGGHIAGSSAIPAPGSAADKMGRESQARAKRKRERDTDTSMRRLLEQGSCSGKGSSENQAMEVVRRARAVKAKMTKKPEAKGSERRVDAPEPAALEKRKYPINVVRGLGFDPTLMGASRDQSKKTDGTDKLSKLLMCMDPKSKDHRLGPPPGKKVRSGVIAPAASEAKKTDAIVKDSADSDSDSDLEIEPPPPPPALTTRNDDSDDDLYVE